MKRTGKIILVMIMIVCMSVLYSLIPAYAISTIHGPYITGLTENSVIIMWETDVRAAGKVEYGTGGNYTNSSVEVQDGLVQVGTRHEVRLTGLQPGTTYNYRVVSTEVASLANGNITLGSILTGSGHSFTTHDTNKSSYSFVFLTDTHDDPNRITTLLNLNAISGNYDFVVHGGDAQGHTVEADIFPDLIGPCKTEFATNKPLYFTHGNHEMRGPASRVFYNYLPTITGEYYYGFRHGKASFAVLDSSEASPDSRTELGGLIESGPYLNQEINWAKDYFVSSQWTNSPQNIVFVHNPYFTYDENTNPDYGVAAWKTAVNNSGAQLVISGHSHVYNHVLPGTDGKLFHHLIVGMDQIAKVTVTGTAINVTIYNISGAVVDSFSI